MTLNWLAHHADAMLGLYAALALVAVAFTLWRVTRRKRRGPGNDAGPR